MSNSLFPAFPDCSILPDGAVTCREYDPAIDQVVLAEFWEAHGSEAMWVPELLPPCGVVAQDARGNQLGAVWVYMSQGVGVCTLEHAVVRPGLTLSRARAALLACVACAEELALAHGYCLMLVSARAGFRRYLEAADYEFSSRPVFAGAKLLIQTES